MKKTIYCDGAGYNGKNSKYCVYTNTKTYIYVTDRKKTNNEMEYHAVIHALTISKPKDTIITDSKLVVGQLQEGWKINYKHLKKLHEEADYHLELKKPINIKWVPRSQNIAGQILDKNKK